jgi:hypothetical protein
MIFAIQDGAVQLLLCRVRENQGLPSLFSKVGKFHLLDNEELDGYLLSFFEVYYLMSYIYIYISLWICRRGNLVAKTLHELNLTFQEVSS